MDELKVGDVVYHLKKGYVGRIKHLGFGKDKLDCTVTVLSEWPSSEEYSNITRFKKDRLGSLLYG